MNLEQVTLLGEADYLPVMESDNKKWRENQVEQGTFATADDVKLQYYYAVPEEPAGSIVIVHGFCEFFAKYHELAWLFWQAGYAFFFLEQRGYGYSEGKLPEMDLVYIDDYRTYVNDLKDFLDQVVVPKDNGLRRILFAHSMGGAVSALFLEQYHGYFEQALLSSPMLRLQAGYYPSVVTAMISLFVKLTRKTKKIGPGQQHFSDKWDFEGSCMLSESRYDYVYKERVKDEHYQTSAASFGWAVASMKATRRLMKHASKIQIPVTIFVAGLDGLVDCSGFFEFSKKVPQCRILRYENAKHEIYGSGEKVRKQYFSDLFGSIESA